MKMFYFLQMLRSIETTLKLTVLSDDRWIRFELGICGMESVDIILLAAFANSSDLMHSYRLMFEYEERNK